MKPIRFSSEQWRAKQDLCSNFCWCAVLRSTKIEHYNLVVSFCLGWLRTAQNFPWVGWPHILGSAIGGADEYKATKKIAYSFLEHFLTGMQTQLIDFAANKKFLAMINSFPVLSTLLKGQKLHTPIMPIIPVPVPKASIAVSTQTGPWIKHSWQLPVLSIQLF